MNRDVDRYRMLSRRTLVLGGGKLALMSILVGRMYYLQLIESDRYRMLADENRISLRLVAPTRGPILDRFGVPLAVNQQNYRVVLVSERTPDVARTLQMLSDIVTLSEQDRRRILRDVQRKRPFVPVTVKENVSWDQVATIEVNTPDLPGVSMEMGEIRNYTFGAAAAHIIGYVGAVSERELTGDPVLSLPGFRVGKTGIERHHERALRGSAGTTQLEVNAVGRVIRELARHEGQPGREITLTIDIELQKHAQKRMVHERSASAAIIDVHTGGLYALASTPSYDPNNFATGIDPHAWRGLLSDPTAPLTNKAIAGQYAPGSTFKMMVALAALEHGLVNAGHTVFCPGHMTLGNHRFHCWKRGGHGTLSMIGAIRESCDVYFYDLARRLGIDRIAEMCRRFGLGSHLDIDLPGEQPGLIPTKDWKLARFGNSWQQGESLVAAIGQGYVLTTPLQLAVMTARLVNGGHAVKPHLTKHIKQGESEQTEWPRLTVQQAHLDIMVEAMNAVTMSPRGTAHRARILEAGREMGGKTGTAQVRRISAAERATGIVKNEDRPWEARDHALFVGYAPIHAPRYAVAVVVEHGGSGSRYAAPIARDLLSICQERDPARSVGPSAVAPVPVEGSPFG